MNIKIILLLCGINAMTPAIADESRAGGLALDQALVRVLENHPELKIADYEAQAMAARLRQAIRAPADRLNVNLEDVAGSGAARDVRGMEASLSLSRTLELGEKAARRGSVAEQEASLRRNERDSKRLDLLAETARRFVHVAADQLRLRIAEESIELIRLTESAVEKRIKAGKTPAAERQRVAIDLANYQLDLEHRRHEMKTSRLRLASLWDSRNADFTEVAADLFHIDALPGFERLAGFLERNPDLVRYLRTDELARARIRLARSKEKPDLGLTAGLRYLGAGDDVALMFSASIPLGTSGRARADIDEAEALSRIEPLRLARARMELYATLFEIYQELQHARDAVDTLNRRIIPAAEKMLAAYEQGFKAGRYSLLELIQIQQQLREARSRAVDMAANYHTFRIEIDRLTGATLI